jgi:D-glycerate 3-kinase
LEPDRSLWQQRLSGIAPVREIHPSVLEGIALPLLRRLEKSLRDRTGRQPLLALNGPVGAGKTSLSRVLCRLAPLAGFRLAVASIDDVYLPWEQRHVVLGGNPFGVSRVPPGSHDIPLLIEALQHWRETGVLRLPRFDKTLADGQGDRAGWEERPADAVVIEGWLMGCRPLASGELDERISSGRGVEGLSAPELEWLPRWNRELAGYEELWRHFDGLWILRPESWNHPRRWRFQAEARQRRTGGGWLPPQELDQLVRATLASLPPRLYQDPLLRNDPTGIPLEAVALLDGRRRCRQLLTQPSSSSVSSEMG